MPKLDQAAGAAPKVAKSSALRLPLRARVPNPPPLFVGRETERKHLAQAVERAPLSVVLGLGGLGKTSLVLHTLHRDFAEHVEQTAMVNLRPGHSVTEACLEVARALVQLHGGEPVSWAKMAEDPPLLVESIIDLAEATDAFVVLDDLHNGEPEATHQLLVQIARYARRSRWIGTSRLDPAGPGLDLAGQVVSLGPMSNLELAELARRFQPDLDPRRAESLARDAAGSPWQLRRRLGDPAAESGADPLSGLEPSSAEFVRALASLEVSLSPEELSLFVAVPSAEQLSALERRSILERDPRGLRLHDVARALVRGSLKAEVVAHWARKAAPCLGQTDEPIAWAEALRLFVEVGDFDRARELLDRRGEGALLAGEANRLWKALAQADDSRLAGWRLRCAVELARPELLAQLPEPDAKEAPLEQRLLWARALYVRGQLPAAIEVARAIAERLKPGESELLRFGAGLLRLHAFFILGRYEEMAEVVATLHPQTPEQEAFVDSYRALCLYLSSEMREAMSVVDRVGRLLPSLSASARCELGVRLTIVDFFLGRVHHADGLLDLASNASSELAFGLSGRMWLLLRADVAFLGGRFVELRALLERLRANTALHDVHWPYVHFVEIFLSWGAGELSGLDERIGYLTRKMAAARNRHLHSWCVFHGAHLATAYARPAARDPAFPLAEGATLSWPDVQPSAADMASIALFENRLRQGASVEVAPSGYAERFTAMPCATVRLVLAQAHFLAGQSGEALDELAAASKLSSEIGLRFLVAEAEQLRCEILLGAGRESELAERARALAEMAENFPSARFAAEARFYLAAAGAPLESPVTLEVLASKLDVAPVAARRARALLGMDAALDAIDRRIIERIRTRAMPARIETVVAGSLPSGAGWGLDGRRKTVWLPEGKTVELAAHPVIWRTLEALAQHGGHLERGELFRLVWNEAEFHPLRHKSRLHTMVNRLRQMLEKDPEQPTRFLTTVEGYRFGSLESVRWLRAESTS
jgi:hypothetical protein